MWLLLPLQVLALPAFGPESGSEPRHILGGTRTQFGSYPFMVYVDRERGRCPGSILSPGWVLTAAHCVVDGQGRTVSPRDMEHGYQSSYGFTQRMVGRTFPHPDYSFERAGFQNDIGLEEVIEPYSISYSSSLVLATSEQQTLRAESGTLATGLGFGLGPNDVHPDGVWELQTPLLLPRDCRNQLDFRDEEEVAHDGTLCAEAATKGVTSGGSGGVLAVPFIEDGRVLPLHRRVISLSGWSTSGSPVISAFTRASRHVDWIREVTRMNRSLSSQQSAAGRLQHAVSMLRQNQQEASELERAIRRKAVG